MKIGVVGIGTVGRPLYHVLKYYHNIVESYDKDTNEFDWYSIKEKDAVFICVPTNMNNSQRLDMSIVDSVLKHLSILEYKGIVIIKSTLGIGYINNVIKKYSFPIIVFPEWLYEKKAFQDTVKPEMNVIGMVDKKLFRIIKKICPWYDHSKFFLVEPEEAVLIKLVANALGSTKISFANQIQFICEKYDINPTKIMDIIKCDPRCSPRYLSPGWSFSGYCLPKDTSELAYCIDNADLLQGVLKINEIIKEREKKV